MRGVVADAVPPHERSLPVTLCHLAAELGSSSPTDPLLESVTTAVSLFEGYVQLRLELLAGDRYAGDRSRDTAILASDYLHAGAYEAIADAPIPDARTLDLYRTLTSASTTLSRQLLTLVDSTESPRSRPADDRLREPESPEDAAVAIDRRTAAPHSSSQPGVPPSYGDGDHSGRSQQPSSRAPTRTDRTPSTPSQSRSDATGLSAHPIPTLAATAAELGAAAVGATTETRAAVATYSRSLLAALAARSVAAGDEGPLEIALRELSGRDDRGRSAAVVADEFTVVSYTERGSAERTGDDVDGPEAADRDRNRDRDQESRALNSGRGTPASVSVWPSLTVVSQSMPPVGHWLKSESESESESKSDPGSGTGTGPGSASATEPSETDREIDTADEREVSTDARKRARQAIEAITVEASGPSDGQQLRDHLDRATRLPFDADDGKPAGSDDKQERAVSDDAE
ncbi:hypothetical protein C484_06157 [Natrialba taiwanensis DSM 12281]|uniref:Uncharacterized protein n=2 Tax=Natrialba taiwanensis TaxID=160846 RepID=M0A7P2_9EURY|nr:hypothetical protein C484_06157 [Natrialba taiwanensis DSM 12281]